MRNFLTVVLFWMCLSVYSQDNFADIEREVDAWVEGVKPEPASKAKAPKFIDFTNQHYSINGNVAKGILQEGTTAKFYNTASLVPELLLDGRVSYMAGRLVIEGVRYITTKDQTEMIYGSFYVYNMDDFTLNLKPKKAGALRIKNSDPSYLKGMYIDRPFIISMKDGKVYLDRKKEGKSFTFLSAGLPDIKFNDDDSYDIYQKLLQVEDGVTMRWDDGMTFRGKIKPTPIKEDIIAFVPFEGERTWNDRDPYRVTVSREKGDIVFSQDYRNNNLSNATYLVKDNGSLSDADCWNLIKIVENCYLAKWKYRNGNNFEGAIKPTITENSDSITSNVTINATKGVFKYPNGDRFEGDISTKQVGPFFIDGTTFFADGSKIKGNWLEKINLKPNQWDEVYKCANPSEAKALAQKLMHKYDFPEYDYSGELTYFNPERERREYIGYNRRLIYDRAKKRYTYKDDEGKTELIFNVNNQGQCNYEIVYKDGKAAYINEFTWYSNGVIESIRTFIYDTKKIYLSCNFFSDGKLRSAYQYGKGNSGENVLRKSKESHPTFGDYTCKLYDLNGNYERTIKWSIGGSESFFGDSYNVEMAPRQFDFGKLKE